MWRRLGQGRSEATVQQCCCPAVVGNEDSVRLCVGRGKSIVSIVLFFSYFASSSSTSAAAAASPHVAEGLAEYGLKSCPAVLRWTIVGGGGERKLCTFLTTHTDTHARTPPPPPPHPPPPPPHTHTQTR